MSNLKAQGAQILERLKTLQKNSEVGSHLPQLTGHDQDAATFPAIYSESDPRDDALQIKNALASEARPAPIADWEIDNVMAKRAQFEVAKQEQWFQNAFDFDTSNPVQLRWAQEVYPEYFRRREEVIDRQAELQKAIAKLKLRGAKTREELDLLYALATGNIDLPRTPLWLLNGDAFGQDTLNRGLFNPRRNKIATQQGPISYSVNPLVTSIVETGNARPGGWAAPAPQGNVPRARFGYRQ